MDDRTEPIKQDIDALRASMTDKVEQIESRIRGTVENTTDSIKRFVDVKYQVGAHPWMALGVAMLAGYALGSADSGRTVEFRPGEPYRYYPLDSERRPEPRFASTPSDVDQRPRVAAEGLVDKIGTQFGDELQLLKAAAISTLIAVVRDTVQQSVPALHQETERLRQETLQTSGPEQPVLEREVGSATS